MSYCVGVEENLRRRKLPRTGTALAAHRMCCPASVQSYVLVQGPPRETVELVLRALGSPEVCDLMDFATWDWWRGGLRHLPRTAGVVEGTTSTGPPELVSQRHWDVAHADTLARLAFEQLVGQGWSVGTPCSSPYTHISTHLPIEGRHVGEIVLAVLGHIGNYLGT